MQTKDMISELEYVLDHQAEYHFNILLLCTEKLRAVIRELKRQEVAFDFKIKQKRFKGDDLK